MKRLIPLLLLVVVMMFAAGCDLAGITVTPSTQPPAISSFGASPPSIAVGESSTLSWTVVGATAVSIDQGIGNVALAGSRVVMPSATTVYTMTATNAAGMSATATAQVIITGTSAPTPTPSPTPSGLPVVNYFTADPPIISAGSSTTLSWSVSNATSVTIDPGVGPVGLAGTISVSPATNTSYTLAAGNASGWYYVSITVLVSGAPAPAGEPDLVIQSMSKSGDIVSYVIKNQGSVAAGASTSTLFVDGTVVANDSVGSLVPGESKTETFTSYTYSCTLPSDTLTVKADTGGTVVESSEVNNSYSESWTCLLQIQPIVPVFTWKPDLVITDIWIDGHTIRYRIKNEGTGASSIGYSRLYIEGDVKGNDLDVPVIAAGDSLPRSFTYNFDCALPILKEVKVTADRGGTSTESDETNNSRTENFSCP